MGSSHTRGALTGQHSGEEFTDQTQGKHSLDILGNVFIALSRSDTKKYLISYNYTDALFIFCFVCLVLILIGKSPVI